jgi:hypothetical protein
VATVVGVLAGLVTILSALLAAAVVVPRRRARILPDLRPILESLEPAVRRLASEPEAPLPTTFTQDRDRLRQMLPRILDSQLQTICQSLLDDLENVRRWRPPTKLPPPPPEETLSVAVENYNAFRAMQRLGRRVHSAGRASALIEAALRRCAQVERRVP